MPRKSIVQLALLAVVIAAATTAIAVGIPWLPVSASRERDRIDFTYWLATGIAIFIFSIVAAAIVFSVWKFRAHPDDDSDGPPIHGHTGLEIFWTAIPTALVTAIAIASAIVLHDNGTSTKDELHVQVTAEQFTWVFTYKNGPAKGVVSPDLYLPIDRSTKLIIGSKDVLHSFWVPEFGQKQDAVPGRDNPLKITPTRIGTYPVVCTELCGLGHALMRRSAIVMSTSDFSSLSWAKGLPGGPGGATPPPRGGASGKQAFTTNGCAACHTFTPAKATGTTGPDLDKLPAEAKQAGQSLASFIRESIVNPNAYIQPGYQKNIMPGTFGKSISSQALAALVKYLASGGKQQQ